MIARLAELNRVLVVVRELMDDRKRASIEAVVRQCASTVMEGRLPDHEGTVEFGSRVGLLRRRGRVVRLTEEGEAFLSLNPEDRYELSEDQRRLLIRSVYLNGVFRLEALALLKSFAPAFDRSTYRWSPVDGIPLDPRAELLLEHLRELGAVAREADGFEVSTEYVDPVAALLSEGKGWTEEALEEFLRERREVGGLAEELVLEFEQERLRASGCEVEAHCVRRISKLKVDAGYDIESFHGHSSGLHYDRFIEVKGSKGSEVRFIWSENEMKVARKLGASYWIYFQGGIDVKKGVARNRILAFQDPIATILKEARFTVTQHGVIVQARLRGESVESA